MECYLNDNCLTAQPGLQTPFPLFPNSATPSNQYRQQMAFYGLMALVNLSYRNRRVQDLAGRSDGIKKVMSPLMMEYRKADDPSGFLYEVRKTCTFCLGNLVKDNTANAELLTDAGGVGYLIDALNDEEDDELTKKAFNTLVEMGDISVHRVVQYIADAVQEINRLIYFKPRSGSDAETRLHAKLERLAIYLPVMNGLIYM